MDSDANSFAGRGGLWVLIQSALMLAVIVSGVMYPGDWQWTGVSVVGLVLFGVGGYFGIAGVRVLGRNRTPFPRPRVDSELIQHGIYARVRHPLYSSVMFASLGWALIWQSVASFLTALVLCPFFHAKARREEQWLRRKFPGYADYARRTPRFLPRLRRTTDLTCNF